MSSSCDRVHLSLSFSFLSHSRSPFISSLSRLFPSSCSTLTHSIYPPFLVSLSFPRHTTHSVHSSPPSAVHSIKVLLIKPHLSSNPHSPTILSFSHSVSLTGPLSQFIHLLPRPSIPFKCFYSRLSSNTHSPVNLLSFSKPLLVFLTAPLTQVIHLFPRTSILFKCFYS